MSEQPSAYNYESDVGNALRRAATYSDNPEQAQALHIAAAYIETAIDQVAGRAQTAIGAVELKVREQVAETTTMVLALGDFLRQMHSEQRVSFESLRAGQQGITIDIGHLAAQYEELSQKVDTQNAAKSQRLDKLELELGELSARVQSLERLVGETLASRVDESPGVRHEPPVAR